MITGTRLPNIFSPFATGRARKTRIGVDVLRAYPTKLQNSSLEAKFLTTKFLFFVSKMETSI